MSTAVLTRPRGRLRLESRLLLVACLVFGLPAVVWVPPFVTFDGPSHHFRALQVSLGHFRPERLSATAAGGRVPSSHYGYVNTLLWEYYWAPRKSYGDPKTWEAVSEQESGVPGQTLVEFTNTALYSPLNYAFQATGMAWARAVSPSPLLADRLGCLLNLLGYAFLGVLILELSPGFHRGLVLIATCPLLILQAASLSADPLNVTLPFLALVGWWRLGFTEDRPRRLALAALGVLGLGLCLLKPTAAALLPCFALLPRRLLGGSSLGKAALLGAYLGLAAGVWYGWNHAALTIDVARWFDPSRPPIAVQRQAFASDPASFLPPFVRTLLHAAPRLGPQLLSYPGDWVPARVNALTAALSFVALAALVLGSPLGTKATGAWMTGLGLVAASSLTAIGLALWLAFGSPGMPEIPGLVGRYLYVPALALALLASALVGDRWARLRAGLFGCGLASNAVALTVLLHVILTRKP